MNAPNANIAARLAERAARHSDRDAIVEYVRGRPRRVTFGDLADRVPALAAGLREAGIRPGDRVLLFVPMSIDLYHAFLACLHAGATVVFVDAWAGRDRIEEAVRAATPRAFVGTPRAHLLRLVSPAVRRIPVRWFVSRRLFSLRHRERPAAARSPERVEPDSAALLTFTTGSTGRPKAVARSHAFLWAQHEVLARHLGTAPTDRDMPGLPIFVLHNLAAGATSVLPEFDARRPAEIDPAAIHRQIVDERVTTSIGSPAFYERLAAWCEASGRELPLRRLFTGGAPVGPALARRLAGVVAGTAYVVYGSSEAEPISTVAAGEMVEAAERAEGNGNPDGLCVGRPIAETQVRLIRPHDGPVDVAGSGWEAWEIEPGGVGEVVVAGPHVVGRYEAPPEANALHKIDDGERIWHRTGDAARLDADGRLVLMGRISQRVRRSGLTWWSLPAELRAARLPGVRHAAFLGLPDDRLGQRTVLCVEVEGGRIDAAERDRLRELLSPIPTDDIHAVERIPRDPRHASKTDTAALRRMLDRR